MKILNIERLINDLGGASKVARQAGVIRTAPYGWIARGYVSSRNLEKLISKNPKLFIDDYFEEQKSLPR